MVNLEELSNRNFGMNYLKANELFTTAGVPKQIRQLLGRHDIKGIEI